MNNLLKPKKQMYIRKSTDEQVYQEDRLCKLIVEDEVGVVKRLQNHEKVLDEMFDSLKWGRLEDNVRKRFNSRWYNVIILQQGRGRDRIARVTIVRRKVLQEIINVLKK